MYRDVEDASTTVTPFWHSHPKVSMLIRTDETVAVTGFLRGMTARGRPSTRCARVRRGSARSGLSVRERPTGRRRLPPLFPASRVE